MINTKLLPDSRGIVSSIFLILTTVTSIAQSQISTAIQKKYNYSIGGYNLTDFVKGGRLNIIVYLSI